MASSDKDSPTPEDQGVHTAARREKLEKIRQLGIDPWGGRFDDRILIRELRAQADQVRYQLENGDQLELPELDEDPEKRINLRQWRSDQGPGEEIGPRVRAAGRILLQRDKGKLRFVDIEDWSGRIQLFIGQRQVGDEAFELAGLFDLGDIIGVEGRLGRTNTGELTIFAEQLFFLTKSLEPPPAKHQGLVDPDLRQRGIKGGDAHLDLVDFGPQWVSIKVVLIPPKSGTTRIRRGMWTASGRSDQLRSERRRLAAGHHFRRSFDKRG